MTPQIPIFRNEINALGDFRGGVKVARDFALGLTALASQRGWEALQAIGWSIQSPRPKNPKSAMPEETEVFKKISARLSAKKSTNIPTSRSRSGPRMSIGSA